MHWGRRADDHPLPAFGCGSVAPIHCGQRRKQRGNFDCFAKELRFAELYLSLPLLAEMEVGKFVIEQADTSTIKPVDIKLR